jgi:BMFP domain-containing protein YqiC
LDRFKVVAQGHLHQGTFYSALAGVYSFFTTRPAQSAQKDYNRLREKVNKTIAENAQDGLTAVDRGNFEVAGSVLSFKSLVEAHLKEHLDVVASKEMENFEKEVEQLLRGKLDKLLTALKDGPDVRRAIADLGHL